MKFSKIAMDRAQKKSTERWVANESKPSVQSTAYLSLYYGSSILRLLKCPFCNFANIYEDAIDHHIQYTHFLDPDTQVKARYTASRSKWHDASQDKENLSLPWIRCLFCNYKDKIEWDLAQHVFERHRAKVVALPIYSKDRKYTKALSGDFYARFESAIEFRLDLILEMSRDENREKGLRYALNSLQNKVLQRRVAVEKLGIKDIPH